MFFQFRPFLPEGLFQLNISGIIQVLPLRNRRARTGQTFLWHTVWRIVREGGLGSELRIKKLACKQCKVAPSYVEIVVGLAADYQHKTVERV